MEIQEDLKHERPNGGKKIAFGIVILIAGLLLLGNNFDVIPYSVHRVIFSWPMILVVIGFINLYSRQSFFSGVILLVIGTFFLLPDIFQFDFQFTKLLWPVLLITVGFLIIFRRRYYPGDHFQKKFHKHWNKHQYKHWQYYAESTVEPKTDTEKSEDSFIDEVNVFGGSKKRINTKNFKGGRITSIFGGAELDFRNSTLAEGKNFLEIVSIFGGVSIIFPDDWNVRVEIVSIMGGFADKRNNVYSTSNPGSPEKQLIIKGAAIFGGGDIKSA